MDRKGAQPNCQHARHVWLTADRRTLAAPPAWETLTTRRTTERSLCIQLALMRGVSRNSPCPIRCDGRHCASACFWELHAGPAGASAFNAMLLSKPRQPPPILPSSCSARQETFYPARANAAMNQTNTIGEWRTGLRLQWWRASPFAPPPACVRYGSFLHYPNYPRASRDQYTATRGQHAHGSAITTRWDLRHR